MKNKFSSIWRITIALVLIASMAMVFAPAPLVSAANGPILSVTIDPATGSNRFVCDTFPVVATVSNSGSTGENVVVSIAVTGGAHRESGDAAQLVYDICNGCSKQASWTVHCTGLADATITVTATGKNVPSPVVSLVTVHQKCKLEVAITSPANSAQFSAGDQFAVTATVKNNTAAVCNTANACLTISNPTRAGLKGGSLCYNVGPIVPGGTQVVNWTLQCLAPGAVDLTVRANGCGQTDCAACDAKITIQQLNACGLLLTITSLPAGKICVGSPFTVTGTVKNTGNTTVTSVQAQLTATTHASSVLILPSGWYSVISSLAPTDPPAPVSWTVTCTGRELTGTNQECLDELINFTAEARGTCGGGPVTAAPVVLNNEGKGWANQKFVIVNILPPNPTDVPSWPYVCVGDEWLLDASVHNCVVQEAVGNISITVSGNAMIVMPPVSPQDMSIPAGQTVKLSDGGGPLPWHVKCTGTGDVTITVKYLGVAGLLTLCDSDTVVVHQKTAADLGVSITAPSCKAVGDTYTVTATITNTGAATAADAKDVTADITYTGDVTLVSGEDPHTIGTVAYGSPKTYTWTFKCTNCTDASFYVTVTGADYVCYPHPGTPPRIIPPVDSVMLYTTQVILDVAITSPAPCAEFDLSQTFCVTARITNNDCDKNTITVSTATISLIGNAELVSGEEASKSVGVIAYLAYKDVSWTVHCKGPGDVDILVTANVTSPCALSFWDAISVHQKAPPVTVEILSPAYGTAFVATSQDFAVTAKVCNPGSTIAYNIPVTATVNPVTGATVSDATKTIPRLDPKECTTLTWTLHCVEQGVDWVTVTAVGQETVSASVPILQYPAAHLAVQLSPIPGGPFPVSTDFDVRATITNTGEADATEVNATLSVTPEGSVAVAAGGGGFTQSFGTIPGHGSANNSVTKTWHLHCNQPGASTITVTATGSDEYGWHQKQECQSTGNFQITTPMLSGMIMKNRWCSSTSGYEDGSFSFDGKASGLTGPFNLEGEISYNWVNDICCSGRLSLMGYIDPAQGIMDGIYLIKDAKPCAQQPATGPCVGYGDIAVYDGLFNVVNGMWDGYFDGSYLGHPIRVAITNGTYCSTMASTPGLAIDTRFIEPASITVKQLASGGLDLGITKSVDKPFPAVGNTVNYTITVTNYGPTAASGVTVNETLPSGLSNWSVVSMTQGQYLTGVWTVGNVVVGASATLVLSAQVGSTNVITNTASVSCHQPDGNPGNNSASVSLNLKTLAITLNTGWNLISLPLYIEPANRAIEDVLEDLINHETVNVVWAYNACEPDPSLRWTSFIREGPPPDLIEMRDGPGYWVGMSDPDTLTVAGEVLPLPPETPPSYRVCQSWNLIGFKSMSSRTASDYLAAIGGKYTIIYGYTGGFFSIIQAGGYLQPGQGYWIALKDGESGTIYP
jgi:uncharacterized repeat protein (TIGR01451 family)